MKICIPIETNKGKGSKVYGHFGSAPFFLIYDDKNNLYEVINNINNHHPHGMCHPMDLLKDKNISIIISGAIGFRALNMLNNAGIRVYKTSGITVEQVLEKIKNNQLEEITIDNACAQHGCHR